MIFNAKIESDLSQPGKALSNGSSEGQSSRFYPKERNSKHRVEIEENRVAE
jgi:hypothetical protein